MTLATASAYGDHHAVETNLLAARQILDVQGAEQAQRSIADRQPGDRGDQSSG